MQSIFKTYHLTLFFVLITMRIIAQTDLKKKQLITRYFNMEQLQFIPGEFNEGLNFSNALVGVKKDSLWGFINKKGKLVIDYQFQAVQNFNIGYASVKKEGNWHVIDKKGNRLLTKTNKIISPLRVKENQAFFLVQNKAGLYGIIDAKKNIILEAKYALILPYFKNERSLLYAFTTNDSLMPSIIKNINWQTTSFWELPKTTVEIFNTNLEKLISLSNTDVRLRKLPYKGKWINEQGQLSHLFPVSEKDIPKKKDELNEELYKALQSFVFEGENGKQGVQIGTDSILIPANFDGITAIPGFTLKVPDKLIPFVKDKFRAHLVKDLEVYNSFYIYYYLVEKEGLQGIYSLDGKEVIAPLFESIDIAIGAGFNVAIDYKTKGLYSYDGKVIFKPTKGYSHFGEAYNNRMVISKSGKNGKGDYQSYQALATPNGKLLTDFKYSYITSFYDNDNSFASQHSMVNIKLNDTFLSGIINRDGKEVVPPKYKYVSFYEEQDVAVLQDYSNEKQILFYDLKKGKIVKEITSEFYNQFLIRTAHDGVIQLTKIKE